jgi:hypothetical protein
MGVVQTAGEWHSTPAAIPLITGPFYGLRQYVHFVNVFGSTQYRSTFFQNNEVLVYPAQRVQRNAKPRQGPRLKYEGGLSGILALPVAA